MRIRIVAGTTVWLTVAGEKCDPGKKLPVKDVTMEKFEKLAIAQTKVETTIAHIKKCLTLLPAGTGTMTLTEALAVEFNASTHNWEHDHRHRPSKKVQCYVMTLRDPATRLESAWRHSLRRRTLTDLRLKIDDINTYVSYFRYAKGPAASLVRKHYMNQFDQWAHGWGIFLAPQVSYLRGLDPSHSVHFICLEHLDDDWRRFLHHAGRQTENHPSLPHVHNRNRSATLSLGSTLSPVNRDFVRTCLYPWDLRLHHAACGSSSSSSSSSSFVD